MEQDPIDALEALGTRYKSLRKQLATLRPLLVDAIRAAAAEGVTQVKIVELTGYTRDAVRVLCLPDDSRRELGTRRTRKLKKALEQLGDRSDG